MMNELLLTKLHTNQIPESSSNSDIATEPNISVRVDEHNMFMFYLWLLNLEFWVDISDKTMTEVKQG